MDAVFDVARDASAVVVLLAPVALALFYFWGRKFFTEKGTSLTPGQTGDEIAKQLETTEHRIRDSFQTVVQNMGVLASQRHEQVTRDLREMKDDLRAALERSNDAHERATDARALANRALDKVEGVEKRLEDQYRMTNASLERIERAVQAERENNHR